MQQDMEQEPEDKNLSPPDDAPTEAEPATGATRVKKDEEIVVGDQKVYLTSWKEYVNDWLASSSTDDEDVAKVAGYLCRLARTNLEVLELCLKSLRRLVDRQATGEGRGCWVSAHDTILAQVQERVRDIYGGTLRIEPLAVND